MVRHLKIIIPWLTTIIFGATTTHFANTITGHIEMENGMLKVIELTAGKCD